MDDGRVAASLMYCCGGLCAAGHVGLFAETPGGWRQVKAMKHWVSDALRPSTRPRLAGR